jgi:hypothetical protein
VQKALGVTQIELSLGHRVGSILVSSGELGDLDRVFRPRRVAAAPWG